jgi:hypothetical protein
VYKYAAGWSAITGPSANPALGAGTTASRVSHSEWRSHLFLTNNADSLPMKIYRDNAGNYQVRNAGLPRFEGADLYTSVTNAMPTPLVTQ